MNREEAKIIIRTLIAAYPNYKPATQNELTERIDLWSACFLNDSFDNVKMATYEYINSKNTFAPSIGHIRQLMYDRSVKETGDFIPEAEAWGIVLKAIRNSSYSSQEEFGKLPQAIQKAVGSPAVLRQMAVDDNFNESVESSIFSRRYRSVLERERKDAVMPNVAGMIAERQTEGITAKRVEEPIMISKKGEPK